MVFLVGKIRVLLMRVCKLDCEKTMNKKGWGWIDFKILSNENILTLSCFDNKPVNSISSYFAVDLIDSVRHYDQKEKTYIEEPLPSIVKVYNTYMTDIEKLVMICSFYKDEIRRQFSYIWFHSVHLL